MRRRPAFSTTICRTASNNYLQQAAGPKDKQAKDLGGSLAAAKFLRYATHSKSIVFGALDDLRRH
jgi:hypothetical protein